MKSLRVLLVLLSTLMVGQVVSYSHSYGASVVGDVRVQTMKNGSIYCDTLICPEGSSSCKVTKRNYPNDFQVIVRNRKCFDRKGDILKEETVKEPNTSNENVNVQVSSGSGIHSEDSGRQLTPEEQRELENRIREIEKGIEKQISEQMKGLQNNLPPFMRGNFGAN